MITLIYTSDRTPPKEQTFSIMVQTREVTLPEVLADMEAFLRGVFGWISPDMHLDFTDDYDDGK